MLSMPLLPRSHVDNPYHLFLLFFCFVHCLELEHSGGHVVVLFLYALVSSLMDIIRVPRQLDSVCMDFDCVHCEMIETRRPATHLVSSRTSNVDRNCCSSPHAYICQAISAQNSAKSTSPEPFTSTSEIICHTTGMQGNTSVNHPYKQ